MFFFVFLVRPPVRPLKPSHDSGLHIYLSEALCARQKGICLTSSRASQRRSAGSSIDYSIRFACYTGGLAVWAKAVPSTMKKRLKPESIISFSTGRRYLTADAIIVQRCGRASYPGTFFLVPSRVP